MKKDSPGFFTVFVALLAGFFLGAGLIMWFSSRDHKPWPPPSGKEIISALFPEEETSEDQSLSKDSPDAGGLNSADEYNDEYQTVRQDVQSTDEQDQESPTQSEEEIIDEDQEAGSQAVTSGIEDLAGFYPLPSMPAEDIRVRRDQLIQIRRFDLPPAEQPDTRSEITQRLDSLIGTPSASSLRPRVIFIEFWRSPLDFRGYKMARNRVILYGMTQAELVSLHVLGNQLFLKYFDIYYPIGPTPDEFQPLIPLSDAIIIEQLENPWN